ncbi:hypothetical protein MACH09_45500 [Vibrio sp. MACH09]|uniref:hypothetical protein n=1 Tax=Vibrio sp. MACH09 TaxID=3025122 RepID=UPI002793A3FB|nr:hypothetical protein [Vibrio sp. MACH09]GLO64042.1 hypothetical protein MACH09_45500 [Vibrio sp. MACH09]
MNKNTLTLCLTVLLATPLVANALEMEKNHEEQRLAELENKVVNLQNELTAMSGSLEKVLILLQAKPSVETITTDKVLTSTNSTESSLLTSENDNYDLTVFEEAKNNVPQKEGLLLDVYVYDDYEKLPSNPTGIPMATLDYKRDGKFNFSEHLDNDETKSFSFTKPVGLYFHGYIQTPKKGPHIFSNMIRNTYNNDSAHWEASSRGKCITSTFINDKKIMTAELDNMYYIQSSSDQAMVELQGGFVKFGYWITCVKHNLATINAEKLFRSIDSNVKIRTPVNSNIVTMPKGIFYHY